MKLYLLLLIQRTRHRGERGDGDTVLNGRSIEFICFDDWRFEHVVVVFYIPEHGIEGLGDENVLVQLITTISDKERIPFALMIDAGLLFALLEVGNHDSVPCGDADVRASWEKGALEGIHSRNLEFCDIRNWCHISCRAWPSREMIISIKREIWTRKQTEATIHFSKRGKYSRLGDWRAFYVHSLTNLSNQKQVFNFWEGKENRWKRSFLETSLFLCWSGDPLQGLCACIDL